MKLHEFTNGLYPRRITIYLAEKSLGAVERVAHTPDQTWPPESIRAISPRGTVPILEIPGEGIIRASMAILEYLEEKHPEPTMIGTTPEARAQVRELVGLADEMTTHFVVWSHKGSDMYKASGEIDLAVGGFAAKNYYRRLDQLEEMVSTIGGRFLSGDEVTIADCVLMATVQFADALYGVPMTDERPVLQRWYRDFLTRPSAVGCEYPAGALAVARGLPEQCPPSG